MAIRFRIGKFRLRGIRFPKWGVRGNLLAAFTVIAGMAIVISAGAAIVLGQLGNTMVDLSGRDIPRLAASLQLSAQSASLASQGPALLASRSEESLSERSRKMKETQAVALKKLGEIIELGADKTVVAADKLRQVLRLVARNGYAIVDQELELGLRSMAVPIQNPSGKTVAALNVGAHAQRVSIQEMQTRFLPRLRTAAQELSMLLR